MLVRDELLNNAVFCRKQVQWLANLAEALLYQSFREAHFIAGVTPSWLVMVVIVNGISDRLLAKATVPVDLSIPSIMLLELLGELWGLRKLLCRDLEETNSAYILYCLSRLHRWREHECTIWIAMFEIRVSREQASTFVEFLCFLELYSYFIYNLGNIVTL